MNGQKREINRQLLSPEVLELRLTLSGSPLLWMEDNNLGVAGGLPSDFLRRFQDPETWQISLRTMDTLYLRESSMRNPVNGINTDEIERLIAPVLNANQVDVAIDTGAATWLQRRLAQTGSTVDQLLASHAQWIESLVNAGLRLKTISLQSVLSKPAPGDLNWSDYPLASRMQDVLDYTSFMQRRFPQIDVGIIDALPTKQEDWQFAYTTLHRSLRNQGLRLDHVHLDMPVDLIGTGKLFSWTDVISIQNYVQKQIGSEFGMFITSASGGETSDTAWHRDALNGLSSYADALHASGDPDSQPDRLIISSWYPHPESSVPETSPAPVIQGLVHAKIFATSQLLVQSSNLLRARENYLGFRLQEEILQVPPTSANASSYATGHAPDKAVFAKGVTDAVTAKANQQWRATANDSNPWLKANLPKRVNVSSVKLWPYQGSTANDGGSQVSIFVSETGLGNPVANPSDWRLVGQADLTGISDEFIELKNINAHMVSSVALTFSNSIGAAGLAALRIFSPNPAWYRPYVSPLYPTIPTVAVQVEQVFEGHQGALIATLTVGGRMASERYSLSPLDSRMAFTQSELRLKPGISLDYDTEKVVAVWVELTDSLDRSQFSKLVTFVVYPANLQSPTLDFGDAPDGYHTFLNSNGASHRKIGPSLGTLRNGERDGQPSANADMATDDDGVFLSALRAGAITTAEVVVANAPSGAKLDAWIDFNGDGSWSGGDEQIFQSSSVQGINRIQFSVPAIARSGTVFARFRISTLGSLSSLGPAADGEVEDYALTLLPAIGRSGNFTGQMISATSNGARVTIPNDLDRDGDLDLVAAIEFENRIVWFENDGRQNFSEHDIGFAAFAMSVVPVDFDGDGDIDIYAAAYGNESVPGAGNELLLFENDGSQHFTRRVIAGGMIGAYMVTTADMDRDGDPDAILTSYRGHRITWHENKGDGEFETHEIGATLGPRSAFAVDIDRDGNLDVVVASQGDSSVTWFRNDGRLKFSPQTVDRDFLGLYKAEVIDFDHDGDIDIVGGGNQIRWYENLGNGTFRQQIIESDSNTLRVIYPVDLDGDRNVDILSGNVAEDSVVWYRNTGGMQFVREVIASDRDVLVHVMPADVDQDGDLDIVATSWGDDSIYWYEQAEYDFGDAPQSFATTLANDGPRHKLTGARGAIFLGNRTDGEIDARPSPLSDQDDLHNTDDEDGIVLLSTMLSAHANTQASLLARSSATGKLDGWIDFNGNGVFDHPAEHLAQGVSIQIVPGNNIIPFEVPSGSISGRTYGRFRVSTLGGLTPIGRANDGEVEDYSFFIFQLSPTTAVEVLSASNQTTISGAGGEITVATDTQSLFRTPELGFSTLAVQGTEQANVFMLSAIQEWRAHSSEQLKITGGNAVDHLVIEGVNQELDLTKADLYQFTSIESIDISGSGSNTLVLDTATVADLQGIGTSISVVLNNDDELVIRGNWRLDQPVMRDNRVIHNVFDGSTRFELSNEKPWTNPIRREDVTFDGLVSPIDALLIINRLNSPDRGVLGIPTNDSVGWKYIDSTGDSFLSPSDALIVINYLNSRTANGEGEETSGESRMGSFFCGISPIGTLDENRDRWDSETDVHQDASWIVELSLPMSNVEPHSPIYAGNDSTRCENELPRTDPRKADYLFGSFDELLNLLLLW